MSKRNGNLKTTYHQLEFIENDHYQEQHQIVKAKINQQQNNNANFSVSPTEYELCNHFNTMIIENNKPNDRGIMSTIDSNCINYKNYQVLFTNIYVL